ncbi:MAG: hypothetical protein NTV01_15920 [Bacteroidia bacterium]|nr:hypothetical protein [Bacteroidia bacterium]
MKKMKKFLVILSLLVFVGVYAAPALTIPQDKKGKTEVVKEKKATKAEAKAAKSAATASCCEAGKGEMKAGCAATCKEAAACKGEGMKAEEKKK